MKCHNTYSTYSRVLTTLKLILIICFNALNPHSPLSLPSNSKTWKKEMERLRKFPTDDLPVCASAIRKKWIYFCHFKNKVPTTKVSNLVNHSVDSTKYFSKDKWLLAAHHENISRSSRHRVCSILSKYIMTMPNIFVSLNVTVSKFLLQNDLLVPKDYFQSVTFWKLSKAALGSSSLSALEL